MFRRIAAAAVCVGMIGASAGAADAAVKAGNYKGTSDQDAKVSLRVVTNKKSVVRYSFEGAALDCSDNQPIQVNGTTTPSSERFPISTRGAFGFTASASNGALALEVKGKIKSPRVTGTLRMVARLNDQRQFDPNGSITCDSGLVKWSAKKR